MTRKERRQAEAAAATRVHPTGYTCKRCDTPAPVGIGYAVTGPNIIVSEYADTIIACDCGHSALPTE